MKLELTRRAVAELTPYAANSKNHGDVDVAAICRSIERFGFNDPIAITPDGIIVEGHGRLLAAQRLGLEDVPVLVIEGLTPDQYDLYRIAHNKIALNSHFDYGGLFQALSDLIGTEGIAFEDMGFNEELVDNLFRNFGEPGAGQAAAGVIGPRAAVASPVDFDIIWDSKEQKLAFNRFLQDQVEAGADKAMGGEVLMAAIRAKLPDLWQQIVIAVPGDVPLDQVAGQVEVSHVA